MRPRDPALRRAHIHCALCRRAYRTLACWAQTKQGVDCASSVFDRDGRRYLLCSYGSSMDGHLFAVVGESVPVADPVCDRCIRRLVRRCSISKVAEDVITKWPSHL